MNDIDDLGINIDETILGIERFISGKIIEGEAVFDHLLLELQHAKALKVELVCALYSLHCVTKALADRQ